MTAKASPRAARAPVRETAPRTEPEREPVRAKVRTRKGAGVDQMHIPKHMIPDGIDLQWNTDSILGQPAAQETNAMAQQGWEPVQVGDFDGRFDHLMAKGHKGSITYGAARLDWRPLELTLEARAEERQAATQQLRTEKNKMASGMPDGVDPNILNSNHPAARPLNYLSSERAPMPIPK